MKTILSVIVCMFILQGCSAILPWGDIQSSPNKIIATHSEKRTILVITSEEARALEVMMKDVEKILNNRWK